ncbi:MAG: phosphatidate cytidylyltransferase [Endomicrobium sp.]|nr:phosphatidate cytidylyltransferase [Endomicrobium sp.]
MLLTRILTAIIGIPFICVCTYYGGNLFYVMMFAVSTLCVKEYLSISKKYNPHATISLIISVILFMLMWFFKNFSLNKMGIYAVLIMLVFFGIELFNGHPNLCINRISSSFLGAFFIPLTMIYMAYIRDLDKGMEFTFFIFIIVWCLDTAAYAFGKFFGRHKLLKNVSPQKTVEGAVAGTIFGIFVAIICRSMFMSKFLTLKNSIALGTVIILISQFSDLAESLIKRDSDVKDSGKIMPGHGGVFDRFDSYMFMAPVVYYILEFLR